jgi:predicted DNA-binding protein (MmcQ/YjbR family)
MDKIKKFYEKAKAIKLETKHYEDYEESVRAKAEGNWFARIDHFDRETFRKNNISLQISIKCLNKMFDELIDD